MGILLDKNSRVLVQGIMGREGGFHAQRCLQYGTKIVAGVTPGGGGQMWENTVPVFSQVTQAVKETGANVSIIFVPPAAAADAILESADAGVPLIVAVTEGIPVMDMVRVSSYLRGTPVRLIGPNCPGLINPGAKCKVGLMPGDIHMPGPIGVVSRSGTLTYEAVNQLTALGLGQSSVVGIGGDPIVGTDFVDVLGLFQRDRQTKAVVLVGEIGGTKEQEAALFIKDHMTKPVVAFIGGRTAPPGKRMGHAGAIITGTAARAEEKVKVLREVGVAIAESPALIGETMRAVLAERQMLPSKRQRK